MSPYNANRLRNHKWLALKHAYNSIHNMYRAHMRCISDIKKK